MAAKYQASNASNPGVERVEGSKLEPKTMANILQASPFLANSRLVIIENLGTNKPAAEQAIKLLDIIPSTTVVVFTESAADQRTTWFKTLSSKAKTVVFAPLSPGQLNVWIKKQVVVGGGSIDGSAVQMLIQCCGDDQWRLSGEINKLLAYNLVISTETISELVVPSVEANIFELTESVVLGDLRQASGSLAAILQNGAAVLYVLSMLQWQLRNLLLAKTSGATSAGELAKKAKLGPFVAEKALKLAKNISLEQLLAAFEQSIEADYQIKSGGGKDLVILEQLVLKLTIEFGD